MTNVPRPRPTRPREVAASGLRRTARQAVRAIRPSDGTQVLQLAADEVDPTVARKVVNLTMRVAEMMLSHGASANDVTATALQITKAYGLRVVHVDVTYTSIYVSYYRGHDREPLTTFRVVRARSIDYTRVQRIQALVARIREGLDIDEAYDVFAAVVRAPHPYRRWVVTVANAATAASVCLLRDASLVVIVVAFLSAGVVDLVVGWLARHQVPPFFMQAVAASIPTFTAIAMVAMQRAGVAGMTGLRPDLVVAGGIVVMLAGLSAMGAAQDALDGYYVTAGARTYEVVMLTVGIVVGILFSLQVGQRLGVPIVLQGDAFAVGGVAKQLSGALLVSAAFAVSTYAGPRTVVLCAVMGVVAWVPYMVGMLLGLGEVSATAAGAFVAAGLSVLTAWRLKVPALALITSAVVPLMPGTAVYRGILEIVAHVGSKASFGEGASTLLSAAGVGVALAAGASLGTYLARPGKANLRHAAPRGEGSAADKAAVPGTPEAERAEARAVEATTGTLPVVRDQDIRV